MLLFSLVLKWFCLFDFGSQLVPSSEICGSQQNFGVGNPAYNACASQEPSSLKGLKVLFQETSYEKMSISDSQRGIFGPPIPHPPFSFVHGYHRSCGQNTRPLACPSRSARPPSLS